MLERAQDLFKQLQERMRITMQVVADLAESVGVPPIVTSLLQRGDDGAGWTPPEYSPPPEVVASAPEVAPVPEVAAEATEKATVATPVDPPSQADPPPQAAKPKKAAAVKKVAAVKGSATEAKAVVKKAPARRKKATSRRVAASRTGKKRTLEGNKAKSAHVTPLQVDDAISGSTYLARILWSLGVANLEGLGSLRPADIARMVMSRSAVSLEPPNIARYIRRNNPPTIVVAKKEGSSSFYKLSAAGKKLFEQHFANA
ncbi:MAG: hypothetical protein KAI47_27580 [Deltaproteobacteria bacterium]|nr:hypothetical protein [Deltaproteobacteria bacterium]